MHIIDIIIVITYLTLCILIGLYKSKSIRTLKEYTLGRAHFPNIVIITTLFATYVGAGSIIGNIEKIYVLGAFFVLVQLLSPLSWLIMAKIYGENIEQFRSCMSLGDIMELLYGKVARWITNVAAVFFSIGTVSMQFIAIAYILNYFLGISYSYSIIVSALIIAIYSSFDGIKSSCSYRCI